MQDLGSEVGKLCSLAVGNFRNSPSILYHSWIGCHHATHVCPDDDLVRVESRSQDGRGIIGSSAAESRERSFRAGTDESGHNRNDATLQKRAEPGLAVLTRQIEQRISGAVLRVGDDELRGVDHLARDSLLSQGRGDKRSRKPLAKARY